MDGARRQSREIKNRCGLISSGASLFCLCLAAALGYAIGGKSAGEPESPAGGTLESSAFTAASDAPEALRMPNILLIIGDDHAAWTLGSMGDPRRATPNLDRLASQGVLFERAYCNAPVCTPSRQSLITGKLPHAVGVTQLMTALPDGAATLGVLAARRGYETVAIGKMHFNGPSRHGFARRVDLGEWERWLKENPPPEGDHRRPWHPFVDPARLWLNADCLDAGLPAKAMSSSFFIERAAREFRASRKTPFAMVVGFYEPHSPFRFPTEWTGRYSPAGFSVPELTAFERREQPEVFADLTTGEIRGIQAAYFTSLSFLDHQIGRLMDALDSSGLAHDTIVVYVGDNGYLLGQHGRFEKHCFYEQAVRVPLIIRWPGQIAAGRRVNDLVEMVDVLPTVLALAGLPRPEDPHGIDLSPLLRGEPNARGRDVVYSEYTENEEAMVRDDRYKLIVGSGARLREDGYKTRNPLPLPGPYFRLYDEQRDPGETHDLSAEPALAAVRERLLERMYERMKATSTGEHAIPAGLARLDAIAWRLKPRDPRPPGEPKKLALPALLKPTARTGDAKPAVKPSGP